MKNLLEDKKNKITELESVLNVANLRFESELKKSSILIKDNQNLKEAITKLENQLDVFQQHITEKDKELDALEYRNKELEVELSTF